jgi:murein DD-endopeptidase MepM/ murein hydrolase activator NlpD
MAFKAPIGSVTERNSGVIWPGKWVDATGFGKLYSLGYHTGADLNLNYPNWDADRHSGVYAMGDGTVTYAAIYSTQVWGAIIVIDHGVVDGKPVFSRYGHVENIQVTPGQAVQAGEQIASVGNGEGLFPYHLHFDISLTARLRDKPSDWPGGNLNLLYQNYVNPKEWLQAHATASGGGVVVPPPAQDWFVIAPLGLRVRKAPGTAALQVGVLNYGDKVSLKEQPAVEQDAYRWGQVNGGMYNNNWTAMGKADQSEVFLSRFQPGGG